jgi:phosphoserine phosphatase RsbU/P
VTDGSGTVKRQERTTDYAEVTAQLSVDAQLTLYTDGVIEARARSGELFGFERGAALSNQPAEVIAQTAQSFVQDDDITVLTVRFASHNTAI